MLHDLRSSLRGMLRRPFYPVTALLVMALGLASGIAAFSYLRGFYRPFPGVDTGGLVRLFGETVEEPYQDVSYLDFLDYEQADLPLHGFAASQPYFAASVRHERFTEVAFLEAVSGSFFSVLDLRPLLGRGIEPADDRPGADAVAVLSHGWWQRSFAADPAVIGSTVYLNFRPFTVVGVLPPDFLGTAADFRPDVFIPIAPFKDRYVSWARRAEDRDMPLVRVYARLTPGLAGGRAEERIAAVAGGLDTTYPRKTHARRMRLEPATWIDPRNRIAEWSMVRVMIAAAGGLLLLVCANVANILLSIAAGRRRELTMRAALGASPARLIRQVLAESVLLALLAGALGLALAVPASQRLGSYFARPSVWGANVPREATIDLDVLLFALAASALVGFFAGLPSALRAGRRAPIETLKSGSTGTMGDAPGRARWIPGLRDMLVTAQVGLAVVLLVVAGLVLRTFGAVRDLDPGFSPDRLLVTHLSTSSTTLKPEERDAFFRTLAERLSDEGWVRAATVEDFPPLSPHPAAEFVLDDRPDPATLVFSMVIPSFFEALGVQVVVGRGFVDTDVAGAEDVAVVNRSLERRFFPDGALGRRLRRPASDQRPERTYTIVGVVADTKIRDYFAEPEPAVFLSYPQHPYPTGSALLVVARGDPRGAVPQLRRWLREYEPHLAIVNVVTYPEVLSGIRYTQRMNAELFTVLAFLAIGLAGAGIFSVMSLAVARRTREIGVRMSIGAQPEDIGRLVLYRALPPVALGLAFGLAGSVAARKLVESLLFGVEPGDPLTLLGGAGVLVVAALVAVWYPARRATRVDPVIALHHD